MDVAHLGICAVMLMVKVIYVKTLKMTRDRKKSSYRKWLMSAIITWVNTKNKEENVNLNGLDIKIMVIMGLKGCNHKGYNKHNSITCNLCFNNSNINQISFTKIKISIHK